MIRNYIYYMPIVITIIGVLSIVLALKNKYKQNNKYIIFFDVTSILYLFVIPVLIHNLLPINVDLIIILIWIISFIGGILYLISLIICIVKNKKMIDDFHNKSKFKLLILVVLIPIIFFAFSLYEEKYYINNSELVLSYHFSENGSFNSRDIVYAVSEKYCKEISIDVDDYYNKMFSSGKLIEINEIELQNMGINIAIENEYLYIYRDDKLIHKKKLDKAYSNVSLGHIFYNEN